MLNALDITIVICALAWDRLLGEPTNRFHPVAWMGHSIRWVMQALPSSPSKAYFAGLGLALMIPSAWATITYFIIYLCQGQPWLYIISASFIFKTSFALKDLGQASETVSKFLKVNDIDQARFHLRSLCSRDAAKLSEKDLLSASISSVAENLCDSVIAPIFYFLLFGLPGAIAYRAINTLDAMIGYMDERRWLGHFSAKFDDLANYIPSRLTAVLLLLSAKLQGLGVRQGIRIMIRDHFATPSPNGGWPMSAMAGLLNIQITKPNSYELGDPGDDVTLNKLAESWNIARVAGYLGFLCLILMMGGRYFVS